MAVNESERTGDGELQTTFTFVMDCPNCGPGTYRVESGVALGCLCDYEPPSLIIECGGDTDD